MCTLEVYRLQTQTCLVAAACSPLSCPGKHAQCLSKPLKAGNDINLQEFCEAIVEFNHDKKLNETILKLIKFLLKTEAGNKNSAPMNLVSLVIRVLPVNHVSGSSRYWWRVNQTVHLLLAPP